MDTSLIMRADFGPSGAAPEGAECVSSSRVRLRRLAPAEIAVLDAHLKRKGGCTDGSSRKGMYRIRTVSGTAGSYHTRFRRVDSRLPCESQKWRRPRTAETAASLRSSNASPKLGQRARSEWGLELLLWQLAVAVLAMILLCFLKLVSAENLARSAEWSG